MSELGKAIGKVQHTFSITNHMKEKVQVSVTFDFSTCTAQDIKSWLVSDRTIALQRPARGLTKDEIVDSYNGQTLLANEVGKKVKSRADRIAELVNVGIPEPLATMAVDDPAKFEKVMANLNK